MSAKSLLYLLSYPLAATLLAGCAAAETRAAPEGVSNRAASSATLTPHANFAAKAEWLQTCKDFDEWEKPGPAYRIYGNTYYVGTCGISAILVAGPDDNHTLIDTGTKGASDIIQANMRAVGYSPKDVSWLLHSHEHFDHVGGFAAMKKLSGAAVVASEAAEPVLESGGPGSGDPQSAGLEAMEPVRVTMTANDGDTLILSALRFKAVHTPGHTPGALTWQWESCEGDVCKTIVYADSLSPISADGYRFSDHPEYVAEFRAGVARLAALECDILLTPHPSSSQMVDRLASPAGLETPGACKAYADAITKRIDKRLFEEASATNAN